jgi:NADH:ubiquinone oxidoreductase subunit 5 (subunit L)/multisubunit Na+/H+ antiporter MnhA subunit
MLILAMISSLIPKAIENEGKGAEAWNLSWAPQVGITFGFFIDPLALLVSLVIVGLASVAGIYAITYYKGKHALPNAGAYHAAMLMFVGGMLGVIFSTDIIEFYLFWEFMVLPTYFLVAFWGESKEKSKSIAIKYFVYMHIGALLLLFGVLWHYSLQPSGLATTNIYLMKEQITNANVPVEF